MVINRRVQVFISGRFRSTEAQGNVRNYINQLGEKDDSDEAYQ